MTGVPGSGKSTIFNELIKRKNTDVVFVTNKFNILRDLYFFYIFLYKFKQTHKYFFLCKIIFQTNNSLWHKINIMRNSIKKIAKYYLYKDKKGIYVFDEGVSHMVFNVFVDNDKHHIVPKESVVDFIALLPSVDVLFLITVKKDLAMQRLLERGHSRMQELQDNETSPFVEKSFIIHDLLKKTNIARKIIEIENNTNVLEAVISVENKLKELDV